MNSQDGDGPPRGVLIAALVVAVGAVVAILVVAALRQRAPEAAPVAIAAVPAPEADGPDCRALIAALPDHLGDFHRAPLAEPAPAGTAAWRTDDGGEPTILRCGLERPAEFVVGAPIQVVDAVQWFRVGEAGVGTSTAGEAGVGDGRVGEAGVGDVRSTWFAVDRPVYVALTLPPGSGPSPIQGLSAAIARSLPATPVDPAPAR
ncbi:DUF3515 domain-containing protein [Mycobacterium sp. Y57]|uniref:DUF3515 domain-containing protein n=1 Tax=Mycolicibacterium xanthum TaxID=2796469 RepID=UPI001C853EA1|nr:DUF3515 domain-containing protein [Mycolicibacterium xanthum]MBX7430695.1 DUF3515 domain-containing protein [Mycolicibacterium xanthum]